MKQFSKFISAAMVAAALFFSSSVAFAQIKAGDNPTSIKATSILELESTNKSFYPPRVALTAANVAAPITGLTAADKGATVYNTTNAGSGATQVSEGLCTWDGAKWVCANNARPGFGAVLSAQNSATGQVVNNAETDVHFTGKQWDNGNTFTPSTGIFVAPVAGKYLITGQVRFPGIATDALQSLNVYKNGGALVNASISFGDNGFGSSNTAVYIADLAVGDQIKLSAFSGVSTYIYGASFSVIKVD